jgi:transposase, IS30 family
LFAFLDSSSKCDRMSSVNYEHIGSEERYAIAAMRGQYIKIAEIASRLGRHRSTIYRELKRNASTHDGNYRATHAVWSASGRQKRSKRNMRYKEADFRHAEGLVRADCSPEQAVGRMKLEGRPVMSHETLYKWIWKDKKAGGTLWQHLRGARKQRRKRYAANDSRGRLAGKKMIGERPAVVERRSRIGDWEIDTVHGTTKAGVVTIVERRSGLVRIGKLERITKEQTGKRTIRLLSSEKDRVKTITADNGGEFHGYLRIERALDTSVYFAQPHHAWERGTNENTNGLIRQYLPKGMPLDDLTQSTCSQIAKTLNNRPRKRLGFKTPHEIYYRLPVVALQT